MKRLTLALVAAVLTFAAPAAHATLFKYSYEFTNGDIFSGTFNGTQNGQFVENLSDVTLFKNGTQQSGYFFNIRFDRVVDNNIIWENGGVISFDGSLLNFSFVNSNFAAGDASYTAYLLLYTAFNSPANGQGYANGVSTFEPIVPGNWSLTAVPDGGSTVAFLALSLAFFAATRRR